MKVYRLKHNPSGKFFKGSDSPIVGYYSGKLSDLSVPHDNYVSSERAKNYKTLGHIRQMLTQTFNQCRRRYNIPSEDLHEFGNRLLNHFGLSIVEYELRESEFLIKY